ncbi:MAG: CvpA family protein [Bryobacteraceae bacterium]
MNWLDFLLLIVVASSMYTGFRAGFARVGIGFVAAIAGLLCGFWFYGIPAAWIGTLITSKAVANLLGFFIVIFAFILAGTAVGWFVARMFKLVGLGLVDRVLGGALGFVRGSLYVVVIVTVLLAFAPKNPTPDYIVNSAVMPYGMEASRTIVSLAPRGLSDAVDEAIFALKKIWQDKLKKMKQKKLPESEA